MASDDSFKVIEQILNSKRSKETVKPNSKPVTYINKIKVLEIASKNGQERTVNNSKKCSQVNERSQRVKVFEHPKSYDKMRKVKKGKVSVAIKVGAGIAAGIVAIYGSIYLLNQFHNTGDEIVQPQSSFSSNNVGVESSSKLSALNSDGGEDNLDNESSSELSVLESDRDEDDAFQHFSNDEYDEVINYFNSFVDGQIYQIGTTSDVNEYIKDFLYNTEAGQCIQYYSKEFGVDPKIAVAIAAGESSLLHEMNDGAATGLFGLEKGIRDQFWVYDYNEQKYVLIVNDPDENFDIETNIRNGIAILAYKYSDNGNIYDALCKYNFGTYGFNYMLDENNYLSSSINDRGWRYYTDDYCSRHGLGTYNYIDNIGKCLFEDTFTMNCRDVEITMDYSTGRIISIKKIFGYNYEEADTFDDIISNYRNNKKL